MNAAVGDIAPSVDLGYRTIPDVLRRWASVEPGRVAYRQVTAEGSTELTFGELYERTQRVASYLASIASPGSRALLLYRSGLDFVTALFACMHGGLVPVPLAPPGALRPERHVERLRAVARATCATVVMTAERDVARIHELLRRREEFAEVATFGVESAHAMAPACVASDPDCPALLQFSSGATGAPRGVVLTHANLLANLAMIEDRFRHSRNGRLVTWLPVFHDMGLIGGVLQPLLNGLETTLIDPLAFLQRPIRWLEAITAFGATVSGGPCFAFDLCVRHTTPEEREQVDLATWKVAFTGGEPVRGSVLSRFASAFGASGFDADAFHCGYGLAEATLMVTAGRLADGRGSIVVDRTELEAGRVQELRRPSHRPSTEVVSCGRPVLGANLLIVDVETFRPAPPGRIGEIWVRSPSVAGGYWQLPRATRETFGAELTGADSSGGFLRTGDLGFMLDGELFVTGRLKDIIIVNGRNIQPEDVEVAAEESDPHIAAGRSTAFAISGDERDRVVVVVEIRRDAVRDVDRETGAEIVAAVRRNVSAALELCVDDVVMARPGVIPFTTSGKRRRSACRRALLDGLLPLVGG